MIEAIKRFPKGNAAGYDDRTAELILVESDSVYLGLLVKVFCSLAYATQSLNQSIATGVWQEDWREGQCLSPYRK